MIEFRKDIRGRGASSQTPNRFESQTIKPEFQDWESDSEEEKPLLRTEFLKDSSKSILTENQSPDIGFRYSVNAYRGCEHGCAYCYARPTHEYLGFSAGLDFESKIMVKEDAPKLLREKLMSKSYQPEPIFMSGVTDCYQPAERNFKLTRQLLEVLLEFRNPVGLITKNQLILRDLDLLRSFAELQAVMCLISVTTLDDKLSAALEPRTSRPLSRLKAIEGLAKAGIPVGVNVAPVIPGLTDSELPQILKAAKEAGATFAGYVPVRLPLSVLPIFSEWLEVHRPERKEKVLSQVRDLRGGKLNDPRFGSRMKGEGPIAKNLEQMFRLTCQRLGLNQDDMELSIEHFSRPGDQLSFL